MVLSDGASKTSEEVLAALEGNLITRGIRVVSSGMTGQVVSDQALREGAAQLPPLERVLVLAKKANIDCVFQLFPLAIGTDYSTRRFVWPRQEKRMTEATQEAFDSIAPERRWVLTGQNWKITGKVINVENGDVLAIVNLFQSAVWTVPAQIFRLNYVNDSLVAGVSGLHGWGFDKPEDIDRLRTSLMSVLATAIAGTPQAESVEKDLDRAQ